MPDRPQPEAYATIPQALFRSSAASDPGRVRSNNEDEVYADDERCIYFVVDGMGGHAAGEQAARIAKERLRGRLERALGSPEQRILEAIVLANNGIYEASVEHPEWRGMACVLTVALIEAGTATVGHVGDSRLYLLHRGLMKKITRDHSPVGLLEDNNELTELQAMEHPRRNEVYRDVGTTPHDTEDENFIDVYRFEVPPDAALLLCSDGLTDALRSDEVADIVADAAGNGPEVVRKLIGRAVAIGKDNVSVVYVEGRDFASPHASGVDPDITAPNPESKPVRTHAQPPAIQPEAPRRKPGRWLLALLFFVLGAGALWLAEHAPELFHLAQQKARPPRVIQVDAQGQNGLAIIESALEEAHAGDSIQLAPGVYREALLLNKDITISGSGASILPPENAGPATAISVVRPANVQLINLQISGDESAGNLLEGVAVEGGSAVLQKVTITGATKAGVEASGNGAVTVEYSSLHDNIGPGAWIRDTASAILRFNNVVGNGHAASNRAPGIEIESKRTVEMVGNTFADNGAEAIWDIRMPSKQVLAGNLFSMEGRTGRPEDVRLMRPKDAR
jgi:serine/threonine protein phosphatase PrpC